MINSAPVLQLKGITKDYPGVRALDHVDLALLSGEVHGLVGENGAGKSTLIKILAGVVQRDAGTIYLHGRPVEIRSGSEAHRLGLSFTHQEMNLIPYLDGAENIFLGHPYPKTVLGTVNWRALRDNAAGILEQLGAHVPLDVPVSDLSRGDQAMISIARAFAGEASIFFLDEPTASLTEQEIEHLFRVIRALKQQGCTVVYVSHRLEEIFEIADRVTVMRDGQVMGTYSTADITQAELIRLMVGRSLSEAYPVSQAVRGRPLLRVEGLVGAMVRHVSFTLHAGEILGLAGLVGSGRTEVLRLIYGAAPILGGTLTLDGRAFRPRSPADAIQQGVVLVPEDRRTQGLVLNRSIVENITLPHLNALSWGGIFLNPHRELEASQRASQAVHLKASSLRQRVSQLSGGNQQKVIFARWLLGDARVLLLDEPSRGIDVGARFELFRIIRDLAAQGIGVLLVSSDLNEILGLSDRIIIMREGAMLADLPATGLTRETVLSYCFGERE